MAATYLTSGENTKSSQILKSTVIAHQGRVDIDVPLTLRFDTLQWLTGFFGILSFSFSLSLLPFDVAEAITTGCHGGIVTNIESRGFHSCFSPCDRPDEPSEGVDGIELFGSFGVNEPSSRSRSYSMMVPSAWDTRKRFGDDGTHRMAVQGEPLIRPW